VKVLCVEEIPILCLFRNLKFVSSFLELESDEEAIMAKRDK